MATNKNRTTVSIKCGVNGCNLMMTWDSDDQCYKCPDGHVKVLVVGTGAGKSRLSRRRIILGRTIYRCRKSNLIKLTNIDKEIMREKFIIDEAMTGRRVKKLCRINLAKSKQGKKGSSNGR